MMSQKSQNSFSRTLTHFRLTFKQDLPMIIIASVISLLIMPVQNIVNELKEGFGPQSAIIFALSVITVIITGVVNLGFLHSKNSSDFYFSLPVKRSELYIAKILASFVSGIIPLFVSIAATSVYILAAVKNLNLINSLLSFFGIVILIDAMVIIIGGFFMLFTGRTFDAIVTALTFCFGFSAIMLFGMLFAREALYGSTEEIIKYPLIGGLSPIVSFIIVVMSFLPEGEPILGMSTVLTYIIVWAAISIILLILSIIYVKRRRTEKAGEAYSEKIMPIITCAISSIVSAFVFGLLFSGFAFFNKVFFVFCIAGGIISAIITEAIINRNFKKTAKGALIGAVCAAICISYSIILESDVINYVHYQPSVSEIASAEFSYDGNNEIQNFNRYATTELKNTANIEKLLSIQRQVIDAHEKEQNSYNNFANVDYYEYRELSMIYTLKNGVKVKRTYGIDSSIADEMIWSIYKSNEGLNKYTIKNKSKSEEITLRLGIYTEQAIIVKESVAKKIFDTYISDLHDIAVENKPMPESEISTYLTIENFKIEFSDPIFGPSEDDCSLYITSHHTKTIELLNGLGLDVQKALSDDNK